MSRLILTILALGFLTACGADGAPVKPTPKSSGITLSGSAQIGIVYGPKGATRSRP